MARLGTARWPYRDVIPSSRQPYGCASSGVRGDGAVSLLTCSIPRASQRVQKSINSIDTRPARPPCLRSHPPVHVACPKTCPPDRPCWPYSSPACAACPAPASRRCAWGLEPHPCQALGGLAWEAAVHDHDRHPLSPGLLEVLRHGESLASRGCGCRHGPDRQHPRRPRLVDVFLPPIGLLAAARRRASLAAPPGGRAAATAVGRRGQRRGQRPACGPRTPTAARHRPAARQCVRMEHPSAFLV
jgi:hypothetical protein